MYTSAEAHRAAAAVEVWGSIEARRRARDDFAGHPKAGEYLAAELPQGTGPAEPLVSE